MTFSMELILALIGSGGIGALITYFINKGKALSRDTQQSIDIKSMESDIKEIRADYANLKEKVLKVEAGTNQRLIKIETQVTAVQAQLIDVSKDVKLIIRNGKFND